MSWNGRPGALAALLIAGVAVAGCGDTVIDGAKTEAALEQNLQGAVDGKLSAVECPSDVEVEAGASFDCTAVLRGGGEEIVELKILNDDADVEVTELRANK
jgi:Domain of unknown function (DUF4333)